MNKKRSSFSNSFGFVLAAAGSAVGLGNIWRFPYLAAKDGGGLFLVVYLILALTFGFALLTTEVAIGRKTKQSPLTAYKLVHDGWGKLGIVACIVPMIIMTYYCTIGGWVLKYCVSFLTGQASVAAEDDYFTGFITSQGQPIVYNIIFLVIVCAIILMGVNKGIENWSKILMPILLVLILIIAVFCLTITHTDASGETRTGLDGLAVYLIPNVSGMSVGEILTVVMDAMGQLFYSLSVAMGIMIAYGSYVRDDANLMKSINQIEIFDTIVAFLAGVMIIPAVYVFMGADGMSSGPGLMFITLPKVFASMGTIGVLVGVAFFIMVFFAALTSAMSILEAIVSSFMDHFGWSRKKAVVIDLVISAIVGVITCLGYNVFYFEITLPNGAVAQILDILDYVSNNILMPVVAIGTCILIGWVVKPKYIIEEIEKTGARFQRKQLYIVMIRFIAPILLLLLFCKSIGLLSFLG